ncbi:MAG: Asp-tRNA(Asn)/Glu-tRNA(Gln) amidotransferase subunit GatB [Planctomycetota bacterium]
MSQTYTTVIGLEVHVQLATQSKLFCRCSTQFGAEPNTQTCPVCIGMPGSLPVMNRQAYQLALKTAIAINCEIPAFTKWDRKQYFYPDLPKGYQISQFDLPMSQDGWLDISDPKNRFEPRRVGITRAHLEDDAGKSVHDEAHGRADSEIDLNRTGTPLLEIVSEPDMRSAAEAKAYMQELRLLLTHIGVSDCNMQEGSMRCDANVNLHIDTPDGKVATPIVEIKNMNSFRAVERAIEYEAERQHRAWLETSTKMGDVPKQTRGWDDTAGKTLPQRSKEDSSDYRYFPDPDLVPVLSTPEEVESVRAALGELPADIRKRLSDEHSLSAYDADVLVNQGRDVLQYFTAAAEASGDYKAACNWITQDIQRVLKEKDQSIDEFSISSAQLADLITAVAEGKLPKSRSKDAFELMHADSMEVAAAIEKLGIEQVDESALVGLCQELLDANPKIVADVQGGKQQAIGSLIGQAKKKNPNVDPGQFRRLCLDLIARQR